MLPREPHTFHWTECAAFLDAGLRDQCWEPDPEHSLFRNEELVLQLPLVVPLPLDCCCLQEYEAQLPAELGRHCVILMQAGAVSIGLFEAGCALHTKTMKKYVVRGKGRAQPAHLKTKGKSRYGSRLRLQNAQLLFQETAERLGDWWQLGPPIERIFLNAPRRMWADFLDFELPEALRSKPSITRIPLDLPRPTTDVLIRCYRSMEHGRILRASGQ